MSPDVENDHGEHSTCSRSHASQQLLLRRTCSDRMFPEHLQVFIEEGEKEEGITWPKELRDQTLRSSHGFAYPHGFGTSRISLSINDSKGHDHKPLNWCKASKRAQHTISQHEVREQSWHGRDITQTIHRASHHRHRLQTNQKWGKKKPRAKNWSKSGIGRRFRIRQTACWSNYFSQSWAFSPSQMAGAWSNKKTQKRARKTIT